jgi:hypothetical protein
MFCTKCGSPNLDDALFCKSCASPFAATGPTEQRAMRSDNAFGMLCKWGIALWTLFCLYGAISGIANVADQNKGNIGNAAAVGLTIGLGVWAFAWFVPTTGAAVLYLLFGRKWAATSTTSATEVPVSDIWSSPMLRRAALLVGVVVALALIGQLTKIDQTGTTSSSTTL